MERELSKTEQETYEYIKEATSTNQPLPINSMPHKFQGAVGKLIQYGLVETYRERTPVSKHGFVSLKSTTCVRVKK